MGNFTALRNVPSNGNAAPFRARDCACDCAQVFAHVCSSIIESVEENCRSRSVCTDPQCGLFSPPRTWIEPGNGFRVPAVNLWKQHRTPTSHLAKATEETSVSSNGLCPETNEFPRNHKTTSAISSQIKLC